MLTVYGVEINTRVNDGNFVEPNIIVRLAFFNLSLNFRFTGNYIVSKLIIYVLVKYKAIVYKYNYWHQGHY